MKKFAKSLFLILAIAVLATAFASTSFAADTVITSEYIYQGEYTTEKHSGFAQIIFGQVSNADAEYGVIIAEVETGNVYAFEGKAIDADGKFGIAIYDMPVDKEYIAKVYSGSGDARVYGEAFPFVAVNEVVDTHNQIVFSYLDNGDNTVTVTATIKGDTVKYAGLTISIIEDSDVLTYVSNFSDDMTTNYDELGFIATFAGMKEYTEEAELFSITYKYEDSCLNTKLEITVDECFSFDDDEEYTIVGGTINLA